MWQTLAAILGETWRQFVGRTVEVLPKGRRASAAVNGVLDRTWEGALQVPETSLDGAERLVLRLYPSAASQVVEGLDSLLKLPYG